MLMGRISQVILVFIASLFYLCWALPTHKKTRNDIHLTELNIKFKVTENILVFASGPCQIFFQESFCNGTNFTIYDNDAFVATVSTADLHFCGINTSSYTPIIAPTFANYTYDMTNGFHNITVVTEESPLLDGSASLRITFFPSGPGSKLHMIGTTRRSNRVQ